MIFTSTTSFSDLLNDSHCSFIPDLFPCLNESLFKIGLLPHSCYSVTTCFLSLDRFPKSQSFRFGLLYGALRHSQVALPFTTVIAIGLNRVNKLFLRLFDKRQFVWVVCWLWWSPQLVRGVGRIWYVTGMWAWLRCLCLGQQGFDGGRDIGVLLPEPLHHEHSALFPHGPLNRQSREWQDLRIWDYDRAKLSLITYMESFMS